MSDDDRPLNAAEYVVGTLTAPERSTFEQAMAAEPSLRTEVRQWETWLAPLNEAIPPVEPAPSVWRRIEDALRPLRSRPVAEIVDLQASMRRAVARWRAAALTMGAVAAGLALYLGTQVGHPPATASYLAVVNRGGDLPALIVRVDTSSDTVTVRSVAAETPANRVLELWYVAAGQAPRSIGLLDRPETRAALPAVARTGDLTGATFAVSVEPPGGSTTGAPTGPVVYSGKLIRE